MFRGKAFRTFFAPFILGLSSAMIVVAATLHITDKAEEPEPDITPEPEVETHDLPLKK